MARSAKPSIRGFNSRPRLINLPAHMEKILSSIQKILLTVQKFVLPRRLHILQLFLLAESLLMLMWAGIFWYAGNNYGAVSGLVYFLGSKLGVISLLCYILTLTPGILKRLNWLPQITQTIITLLTLFRRHFGILMFLTAFVHMSFTTTLPQLVAYNFDFSRITFLSYQFVGLIGWILLFPLWLTSNDMAVRRLGPWWKRLQNMTYLALFFIFAHVALQGESLSILLLFVGIMEVVSRIVQQKKLRTQAAV